MATKETSALVEGAYLTNGSRLVRVVEIRPDGSCAVEDARTERVRILRPPKLATYRRVKPSDG